MQKTSPKLNKLGILVTTATASLTLAACTTNQDVTVQKSKSVNLTQVANSQSVSSTTLTSVYDDFTPSNMQQATLYAAELTKRADALVSEGTTLTDAKKDNAAALKALAAQYTDQGYLLDVNENGATLTAAKEELQEYINTVYFNQATTIDDNPILQKLSSLDSFKDATSTDKNALIALLQTTEDITAATTILETKKAAANEEEKKVYDELLTQYNAAKESLPKLNASLVKTRKVRDTYLQVAQDYTDKASQDSVKTELTKKAVAVAATPVTLPQYTELKIPVTEKKQKQL